MSKLQELLNDDGSVQVREYSGRGMYGKKCLAITGSVSECQNAIAGVVETLMQESFDAAIDYSDEDNDTTATDAYSIHDDNMELVQKVLKYSQDSMGLDVVMYWPRIEFVDDEELDEDDE